MATTLIKNANIVNEGKCFEGALLVDGEQIAAVIAKDCELPAADYTIDARGMYLLPGVIDDHVHMRDPGLTHKADMDTETRAAAAGGVTSVMDMPNVNPQTTTNALWQERMDYAAQHCRVNYAFYLGATNDNIQEIKQMDTHRIPAVKLFMGSSTGNMLVDKEDALRQLFRESPTLIMTHCEDTNRINQRMQEAEIQWGEDPDVTHHAWIRDEEACYQSSALAVKMAQETGARLHIAHITTQKELELIPTTPDARITAEACVAHLLFCEDDYHTLGTRIKCNPSIKSAADREALREALNDGHIRVVGTDHAPHLLSEKEGGCKKAVSGMPMVQFSLPVMLGLADQGFLSLPRVVELMCHQPAELFGIEQRGYLRAGYKADLVLVSPEDWTVRKEDILSKCGWSPLEGQKLHWKVRQTWCNGQCIYTKETGVNDTFRGQALTFNCN